MPQSFNEIWSQRDMEKDMPCEGDVHVAGTQWPKGKKRKPEDMPPVIKMEGDIIKANDEKRLVTGWASIVTKGGQPVVDHQGDIISVDELSKAAHAFMNQYRVGKALHSGSQVGEIVESMVFDKDLQQALGIDLGKEGWLIKYHVKDPSVWASVKKGGLKSFSIGGRGVRTKVS